MTTGIYVPMKEGELIDETSMCGRKYPEVHGG
jgi:hypothetical protein